MRSISTVQSGVEVVREFDDEGRTKNYALRSVDPSVKQATVDIVMSPLNAGEAPRIHRRLVHLLQSSWTYIMDANSVHSSQNLGVVAVRSVGPEWTEGAVEEGIDFITRQSMFGDMHVLSVLLMTPRITNLALELEIVDATGAVLTGYSIVSNVEFLIDVGTSLIKPPRILRAFGSHLSVS